MKNRICISIIALILLSTGQISTPARAILASHFFAVARSDAYYRTELYFGRSIPGGGQVSDNEWETFLADIVTPRFPDGFTIVRATGQYREQNGTIDKELSEVLVFFYPVKTRTASRRKIEEIRRAYKKQFKQESVLRLDFPAAIRVSF